ncbi:alkaline phosphatase family protein, partial [bacterium]|nr:alkaline phosphatase family protein [bacterium]
MSFSRQNNLSRRRFLKSLAAAGAAVSLIGGGANGRAFAEDAAEVFESGSTPRRRGATAPKMLILGIDGMDPVLLQQYVSEGRMPNFQRLIEKGDFSALGTSAPPQSPVAWSNFITGMDSGGHGIYDFLHRDPKEQTTHGWTGKGIHFSMSSTERAERMLNLGAWSIPLEKGKIHQLRQGQAFWQILEENGIPTTIFKMPANFPPVPSPGRSISGMGTPDLLGEQGVYSLYVTNLTDKERRLRGGEAWQVDVQDDRVDATILGPANNFRREKSDERGGATTPPRTEIPFQVYLDPERPVVKLAVQNQEMILQEGEWSGWVRLKFKLIPGLASVNAIVRFYLQKARPEFRLYMTPLQIDPADPAMPISTPAEWSRDLARELGPFFTQGLPVDTKALSDDTIDGFEYWKMSQHVMDERRRAFHYLLDSHEEGLLFFYFNNIDQDSHMLWHYADSRHPNYDPENGPSDGIPRLYEQADEIMGHVLETIDDDTTLIVMSDHGFSPFYHGVNLNSWLVEKGYL